MVVWEQCVGGEGAWCSDYAWFPCMHTMVMSLWVAVLSLNVVLALEARAREDEPEVISQDEHYFTYHVRPALQSGHNPYLDGYLRLECVVSGPLGAQFSLEWRYRSSRGDVTKLEGIDHDTRSSVANSNNQRSTLIVDLPNLSGSHVGHYWCVVVADGNEQAVSGSAILSPPEAYAGLLPAYLYDVGTSMTAIRHPRQAASPTEASTQPSSDSYLKGPLYAVLAVVVVFCGVIVVLTISVVILCHRKCKVFAINRDLRVRTEHTANSHEVGPPPQATQSTGCTTCEQLPVHTATEVSQPPQPPQPQQSPQKPGVTAIPIALSQPDVSDYSKLAEWTGDVAPPTSSTGPLHTSCPGPHNIYSTMDTCPGGCGHYYHMLEQQGGGGSLTNSSMSSRSTNEPSNRSHTEVKLLPARKVTQANQNVVSDGTNYSNSLHNDATEKLDHRYLGDYERHPDYIPKPLPLALKAPLEDTPPVPPQRRQSLNHPHRLVPSERTSDSEDPRYLGDYERDPHYVPPLHKTTPHKTTPSPLDEDNYQGDYERDPNYVPTQSLEIRPPDSDPEYEGEGEVFDPKYEEREGHLFDPKYEGDYERDPEYLRSKIMFSPQGSGRGSLHQHPYATTNMLNEGEPVPPPYHHHGYKALDSTLRDPLRHYTQLSIDQTINSPSHSELT